MPRLVSMAILAVCTLSTLDSISVNGEVPAKAPECEVCVKVLGDLKATAVTAAANTKKGKITEALVGSTLESFCDGNKKKSTLNRKDAAVCYNLLPMKADVARQISFNKDPLKICKSLSKKNPDFCTIRYPIKTAADTDYSKMRVKQLKAVLADRGVDCNNCIEKGDYIKRCTETQHMEL